MKINSFWKLATSAEQHGAAKFWFEKKLRQRAAVLTQTKLNAMKFRVKVRYRISIERGDLISGLNFLWFPHKTPSKQGVV